MRASILLALSLLVLALGFSGLMPKILAAALATPLIAIYAYVFYETKRFKQGPPRPAAPIGEKAVAVEELNPTGMVKLHGVYWRALCEGCRAEAGEEVLIVGYKDGVLLVKK